MGKIHYSLREALPTCQSLKFILTAFRDGEFSEGGFASCGMASWSAGNREREEHAVSEENKTLVQRGVEAWNERLRLGYFGVDPLPPVEAGYAHAVVAIIHEIISTQLQQAHRR